nr:MAG TPA: hypothetical protein [Bacteriophage sp.]
MLRGNKAHDVPVSRIWIIKNPDRFRSGLFLNLFCVRYALKPQLILYATILLASCQHFY